MNITLLENTQKYETRQNKLTFNRNPYETPTKHFLTTLVGKC